MTKIFQYSVVLFLSLGLASAIACETKIVESPNHIGLVGCISGESSDILINALRRKPKDLVIQSEGGDVDAALKIAIEIRRNHLAVRVRGYCNSSCANYIIPAARKVSVEANSRIVYHGDARITLDSFSKSTHIDPKLLGVLNRLAQAEIDFEAQSPKASLIHELQRVAIVDPGRDVKTNVGGDDYLCKGMGLMPWSPSIPLLIKSKIVDQIVPFDASTLPEIAFRTLEGPMGNLEHDPYPMDNCKKLVP